MKKTSKILSFVLALVMVFSLSAIVPLTANAAQTDANGTALQANCDYLYDSNYFFRILDD